MPENSGFKPNPPELDGVDDMTSLLYLEEENVTHNLKIRYQQKKVYTNVGSILLAINPYEWIENLYNESKLNSYISDPPSTQPHVYQIANRALTDLKTTGRSQAMLICGESGSGKTESAKCCVMQLVNARKSLRKGNFVAEITALNPILV